jgi:hypothetical protein
VSAIRPRFVGAVIVAGMTLVSATVLIARPVGAATEGSLRARAAAVESRLASESVALDENAVAYLSEQTRYRHTLTAEAHTRSLIVKTVKTVKVEKAAVRAAAITAYVNAGGESPIGLYLNGRPDELAIGAAYTKAANDHVASSIAALTGTEVTLSATFKTEQTEVTAAARSLAATIASRSSVLAALSAERNMLSSVNGQLASLVREAEIARQRAAAQAAAAAAAAAATAAAAANSNLTSAPASAGPPAIVGTAPVVLSTGVPSSLSSAFAAIRQCESSGDYALNTGNGYYGAYQFSAATWSRLGGSGLASNAAPADQDAAAYKLYLSSGWAAWPVCSAAAGL